jgi:hypothetical protein
MALFVHWSDVTFELLNSISHCIEVNNDAAAAIKGAEKSVNAPTNRSGSEIMPTDGS